MYKYTSTNDDENEMYTEVRINGVRVPASVELVPIYTMSDDAQLTKDDCVYNERDNTPTNVNDDAKKTDSTKRRG